MTIQPHGHDKYKRTIGEVILPDGMNLNQELVKQGFCWWYRIYSPGDTVLEGLENVPVPDGFDGLVEMRW